MFLPLLVSLMPWRMAKDCHYRTGKMCLRPRIKQLARFAHTHPGGPSCHFNDIIPLTHCPHDVQDMQGYHHPLATNHQTQYGTVGQALHIARKLLPFIPDNAGVLIVPCCRGGSAFIAGSEGTYSERHCQRKAEVSPSVRNRDVMLWFRECV